MPSKYLSSAIEIAREAGQLILSIYQHGDFERSIKADDTPVTSADLAAHQHICQRLQVLTPDIPVLSEEAAAIPLHERARWPRYWLVDPLDGTQEFIAGSGDFATIIALIDNHRPVMGVVYAPVSDVVYYACQGEGAFKTNGEGTLPISTHTHRHNSRNIAVAISRRQDIDAITNRLDPAWNYHLVPLGSAALKACLVAEGAVDCYLRLGPTGEWDTAATQCIVEEAGGRILNTHLQPLSYNLRETLENPNFITLGDETLPWSDILTPDNRLLES
ncbi:3'(2'),5'-bisphosphate nucleotidase CysQ [Thaumasiovibrio sp. DFM-14]|uniref:3'(2'),5'-bisphosphate nucleotidase CysQ n=1 Tax=Thaumasiovibrio sp. DFM-14 TaxID=3384792 RepID=UPI00399F9871